MVEAAERVRSGDRLALARALTAIENEDPAGLKILSELYPYGGRADRIGVTGPPGCGKSSLVARLAWHLRQHGLPSRQGSALPRIAVVAVDPSSPFTGGAILGDRIRMRDLAGDPGIFIRSMASRGALGGLARATAAVIQTLDGAGFDVIIIETVGAGQAEVEIARTAHTTIVVEAPGMGDDVQAIKAGILEIADILVVNKADLPGAENALKQLRAALGLGHPTMHTHHGSGETPGSTAPQRGDGQIWVPKLLLTCALQDRGLPELVTAIDSHLQYLASSGRRGDIDAERARREVDELLRDRLARWVRQRLPQETYQASIEAVVQRQLSPTQAVESIMESLDP